MSVSVGLAAGVQSHALLAGVQPHVLLTGVQTDRLSLAATAVELAALALYVCGVRRLARRGRHWPVGASGAFCAGLLAIWVAVGSGLASYDDVDATVHVVQHVLLMMVAAPLLAMGKPFTLAAQSLGRVNQVRLIRAFRSRLAVELTFPALGWAIYYGSMYLCLANHGVYGYLSQHPLVHDASHLGLLTVGYLYWQPLVGGDPTHWRLSHRARMGSVLAGVATESVLAILVIGSRAPLGPGSRSGAEQAGLLGSTHLAGATFLVLSLVACGLCCAVIASTPARRRSAGPKRRLARP